jgi:hypothetical protein
MLAATMAHWRFRYDPDLIEPWFVRKRMAAMLVPDNVRKIVVFLGIKEKGIIPLTKQKLGGMRWRDRLARLTSAKERTLKGET